MPFGIKRQLQVTLFIVLFAGKLRRYLGRYRKRRELIQEWIDLEINNITCIELLNEKVKCCKLHPSQAETLLYGLDAI
jgi:hypothetical protein